MARRRPATEQLSVGFFVPGPETTDAADKAALVALLDDDEDPCMAGFVLRSAAEVHPNPTPIDRPREHPGYSLSRSRELLCRACARTELAKHNGYHPLMAGKGYTIPLLPAETVLGACMFCGAELRGQRSPHGGIT